MVVVWLVFFLCRLDLERVTNKPRQLDMVCPMRIIVIAVSVIVALALALIALLSDDLQVIAPPEKENPEDETSIGWKVVDFMNGKFLWRQYVRCRGTKNKANKEKIT